MASAQVPLLFFRPQAGSDLLTVAPSLLDDAPSPSVVRLNPHDLLQRVKRTRGFARLKIELPQFSFDSPRIEAAMEGTALTTHIRVGFFGNFENVAKALFKALTSAGLVCYSIQDNAMLSEWPKWEEPTIDRGFANRMQRVLQHKTVQLREMESNETRRRHILDEFVNSAEFRSEMAREARRELGRGKKTYDDVLNVYAKWKNDQVSPAELSALRKLDAKLGAMSLADLRAHVADSPRLLLATAVAPRVAAELQRTAKAHGLKVEAELP